MNEIIGKLIRLFYEHQTGQVWCLNIFGRPHLEYVPVKLEELGTNDLLIGQKVTETVTNMISPFEIFPQGSHPDGTAELPSMKIVYVNSLIDPHCIVHLCMCKYSPMKQYFNDEKLVFGIGERMVFETIFDSNKLNEFDISQFYNTMKKCEQLAVENRKVSDQYKFDKKKYQAYYMLDSIKSDFN